MEGNFIQQTLSHLKTPTQQIHALGGQKRRHQRVKPDVDGPTALPHEQE